MTIEEVNIAHIKDLLRACQQAIQDLRSMPMMNEFDYEKLTCLKEYRIKLLEDLKTITMKDGGE